MKPLGPFRANPDRTLSYVGNRLYPASRQLRYAVGPGALGRRISDLAKHQQWSALARINDAVHQATVRFFSGRRTLFVPPPLTTRMISSPGALHGRERISYTTDTAPVRLRWFDEPNEVFLAESAQIYLEIALVQAGVDEVYAISNSFRKEHSDVFHLSEFHHIEYEGKISRDENDSVAEMLLRSILIELLDHAGEDLSVFIDDDQRAALETWVARKELFHCVTLLECLEALYHDTGDDRYRSFTLEHRFGRWEEVRVTELFCSPLAVRGYPIYEVPFYHDWDDHERNVAANTDFIWSGYAEIIGAGRRIASTDRLAAKAESFDLPHDDYRPYLWLRNRPEYIQSAGFGLGWERLLQGILCLPSIDLATPFPRTHHGAVP